MKTLKLTRTGSTRLGTTGVLEMVGDDGVAITPALNTIERPWLDNRPNESCIPAGVYMVHRRRVGRLGVEGGTVAATKADMDETSGCVRYAIQMHAANRARELLGCIAPGMWSSYDMDDGTPYVADSRIAMGHLLAFVGSDVARLLVTWERPT